MEYNLLATTSLEKCGVVKYGKFILKSGEMSDIYFNFKKIIAYPDICRSICDSIHKLIILSKCDCICGIPQGAVPFASYISIQYSIPMIMVRREIKDHRTQQQIEGLTKTTKKVCLIEDVVTTGSSVRETIDILKRHNLEVVQIISIMNRSKDREKLKYTSSNDSTSVEIPFDSLYTPFDFEFGIKIRDRITKIIESKGSSICLAADVDNWQTLVELVNKVGHKICILKIHVDTLGSQFGQVEINIIRKLKRKYNILIWEDRKFSDIGNTVSKQVHSGVFRVSEWADIISCHAIAGYKSIPEIPESMGVFLISEMSTEENLISDTYTTKAINIAEEHPSVVGIVCQNDYIVSSKLLKVVPGISINESGDTRGQKYSLPIEKGFADILVVGRSIYKNKSDPLKTIEKIIEMKNDVRA